MKKMRYILAAALVAGSVGIAAPPASAGKCDPDGVCPECENEVVNKLMLKLFGQEFECA